jgi:polysaccharide biosynthesis/export protein
MHWKGMRSRVTAVLIVSTFYAVTHAQVNQTGAGNQKTASNNAARLVLPKGYVIGPEDVLSIVVWREKEMSADVVVRPDGKISLPLLNDLQASGYTPEQLAEIVEKAAAKYVTDSDATVIVKAINSRKVFVLGEVAKPGTVPLTSEMNVLQLIATVGGFLEYANRNNVTILRIESGRERRFKFNYNEVVEGKNLQQNIMLQPGDTVLIK